MLGSTDLVPIFMQCLLQDRKTKCKYNCFVLGTSLVALNLACSIRVLFLTMFCRVLRLFKSIAVFCSANALSLKTYFYVFTTFSSLPPNEVIAYRTFENTIQLPFIIDLKM